MKLQFAVVLIGAFLFITIPGCGGSNDREQQAGKGGKGKPSKGATATSEEGAEETAKRPKFKAVQIGADAAEETAAAGSANGAKAVVPDEKKVALVMAELKPFQIMFGEWRWVTQRKFGKSAKGGEDLKWVWDFKTDKSQPAIKFHTDSHPYFHAGSLTYIPADSTFRLTTESPDGEARVFEGSWAEGGEPTETLEGKKTEHSFKLQLVQVSPKEGEQWRIVINQQNNDRYLFDLKKKPPQGTQFGPLDVVASQRQGSSFASTDSDNPGPKCIISGGLGSSTVTYKGKSYPVCCSGCAAAFNDDPERWLAKLAKAEAEMKKKDE